MDPRGLDFRSEERCLRGFHRSVLTMRTVIVATSQCYGLCWEINHRRSVLGLSGYARTVYFLCGRTTRSVRRPSGPVHFVYSMGLSDKPGWRWGVLITWGQVAAALAPTHTHTHTLSWSSKALSAGGGDARFPRDSRPLFVNFAWRSRGSSWCFTFEFLSGVPCCY